MATLDTLKILIEADARGLSTQLKRATDSVLGFVDKMNDQQVNWQKVLAGSLDTAIISGIASSFALAIEQTLSFQNSLLNVSNNTGAALGSTSDQMNLLTTMAGQTGAGIGDTTAAFEAFYKQFGNAAAAQTLTTQAGQLALASNQNLSELMPTLIQLFNQWGITTLPAAEDALTGLVNAAGKGKFTLDELISTISDQGPLLSGKTNIKTMAIDLQALSSQTSLTKSTIVTGFQAISQGIANPLSQMSILVRGVRDDIKGPDGLIKAFSDVAGTIKAFGPAGVTMANGMGIGTTAAVNLGNQGKSSFDKAAQAAKGIQDNLTPLQTVINNNISDLDKFKLAWSGLLAELTKEIGIPVLDRLTGATGELTKLLQGNFSDIGYAAGHPETFLRSLGQTAFGKNYNIPGIGAGNAPGNSASTTRQNNVTVNITNNISGSDNSTSSHQIMGQSLADKAYQSFMGLLASL